MHLVMTLPCSAVPCSRKRGRILESGGVPGNSNIMEAKWISILLANIIRQVLVFHCRFHEYSGKRRGPET